MIKHPELQARVNRHLERTFDALSCPCPRLKSAMCYAVLGGGKRVRGILAHLVGEAYAISPELIDPIATAIECLHAYTLIHDDLPAMDDDDMRRHQPSCHIAFDEATAILAGDALQALAFEILLSTPADPSNICAMLQHFADVVGANGLCSGQSLDMQQNATSVSITALQHSHRLKTGVLFSAACSLPAIAAGCSTDSIHTLKIAGEAIGMLFQINDDMLDLVSDSGLIGKTPGKDQATNKASFANCLNADALSSAQEEAHARCLSALRTAKLDSVLTMLNT